MKKDTLDLAFGALADGTRRSLLERIGAGEVAATALANEFSISQPAISKHLSVLERAGLIQRRRSGRHNYCSLKQGPIGEVERFLAKYKQFWERRFAGLDRYLKEEHDGRGED